MKSKKMDTDEQKMSSWIERVEDLVNMLEGSTIGELELTEAGTEIIIRRQPGLVMVSTPTQLHSIGQPGVQLAPGASAAPAVKEDSRVAIIAPLTGVYYSAPSPSSPPFVSVGDVVQTGQVIALVEAMKVFNEIQAEISGRVSELVAPNGEVVQKGDVLIRIQPA
jgi:acetyl-CoA carboxylase biotin carboxyl carrier protein